VRAVNLYHEGDTTPAGVQLENCSIRELWKQCETQSKITERVKEIKEFNRQVVMLI